MPNNEYGLSFGYNREGQGFFDYLKDLSENYTINNFYFNPLVSFDGIYDYKKEAEDMKDLLTHGIVGNILFNVENVNKNLTEKQKITVLNKFLSLENLNIKQVTVLNQKDIDLFKTVDSNLEFHVSTRVNINSIEDLSSMFNINDIAVVNLNYNNIFNLDLFEKLKKLKIKVKVLANEGCFYNRGDGFIKYECQDGMTTCCTRNCYNLVEKSFPWTSLVRQRFNKFFIDTGLYNPDIVKFSTRDMKLDKIKEMFNVWISETLPFTDISVENNDLLDFVKQRLKCKYNCFNCEYCKILWYKYREEKDEL